ncbi:MAG: c-type cytochrome [Deltaproteobacteria bacterium]|nr:c-type cytochrome [Deltaproteobacteria bacterium]
MQRNVLTALGLTALLLGAAPPAGAAELSQTEQVRQGWQVFNEKRCISCHAVWGEGERIGPDLARSKTEFLSAGQLAGVLWNHAPDMWSRMVSRGIPVRAISEAEMDSLFSFLYFIRFIDEPGDAARGEALVHRKKCDLCHATEPGEKSAGPNFRSLGVDVNPIVWAQSMWNHAPAMFQRMRNQGLAWPTFDGNEMADLIAYVRGIADNPRRTFLEPGDRNRGQRAFHEKGCARCHASNRSSGAPQLETLARNPKTLGQMAGLMWNHAPAMVELARSTGLKWSAIDPQDMADLVTYFLSMRFHQVKGDAAKGERVFAEKRCDRCHSGGAARDFKRDKKGISAIQMSQFMWVHGLEMLKKMEEARIPWPRFEGRQMVDLLAYLNAGLPQAVNPATGSRPTLPGKEDRSSAPGSRPGPSAVRGDRGSQVRVP